MDPVGWRLGETYCNLHRKVFWETFAGDKWQSLFLGRPPHFPKWMVRCDIPYDDGEVETGEPLDNMLSSVRFNLKVV